jgi:methylase of polypeptide subunit release factors
MPPSMPLNEVDSALFQLANAVRETGYQFTTATPATHERVNNRIGNEWARNLQDVFGWSRPFLPTILPPPLFELMQAAHVAVPQENGWKSSVRISSLQGQFFLHSAFPTVQADSVFFGPDTYRYASALHSLFASGLAAPQKAVDIGCGAGPGAILTALAFPEAEVFAVDINDAALRLTRVNALLAKAQVEACHSNLLNDVSGSFDLIVANPPYLVDPTERAYRHGGGPLGAGLSLAIVDAALERLAPGGTLLLYTGAAIVGSRDPFLDEVKQRLSASATTWSYREADPDVFGEELLTEAYSHTDRIAAVVLTVTRAA